MSNGYYRPGDFYWDTSGQQLYRCKTAGDKTSSVWVAVGGGGGGSVQQFSFVADGGDYILATPAAGSPAVTTLASTFTNTSSVTTLSVTGAMGIAVGQNVTGTGVPSGVIVVGISGTTITTSGFTASANSSGNYTFGGAVCIAKPPKLRCSLTSESYIDGTGTHTFTYTAVVVGGVTVAYTRTNTWSAGNQSEQITPAYLAGDIVYALAMPISNLPVTPGSGTTVAVALLDIHDKDWAT